MNKQLIFCMPIIILCMLKLNEVKKMLKEEVLFFVLHLLEIVLRVENTVKILKINLLISIKLNFNSLYLAQASFYFNSLYRASVSLKMEK